VSEPLSEEAILRLVTYGVSKVPIVNQSTLEHPDLRDIDDAHLAVTMVCYAASLAKLTQLDLRGFLQLAVGAYQSVEITRKEKQDGN